MNAITDFFTSKKNENKVNGNNSNNSNNENNENNENNKNIKNNYFISNVIQDELLLVNINTKSLIVR